MVSPAGAQRRARCVRVREPAAALRHEFIGLYGMVERNWYLIKRYAWWEIAFFFWTAANTLTIVFIAKGVVAEGGSVNIDRLTTILLIGAVIWSYLGIVFELLIETVAWERWEGTIEYTFMAPLTRAVHLLGTGIFAIGYGIVRASIVFAAIAAFFGLHMPNANFFSALVLIAVASISFVGIGMMTAVLPLISPEKGTQFGRALLGTQHRVRRPRRGPTEVRARDAAHTRRQPGLFEDRLCELGPSAVAGGSQMPDTGGPLDQRPRRRSEMADVRRRASLVVDDRHLLALAAEPQHGRDEVLAGRPEQPRGRDDPR